MSFLFARRGRTARLIRTRRRMPFAARALPSEGVAQDPRPRARIVPAARASARGKQVANVSVVSVIVLGVVGVMVGSGVAGTAIGVSDGMTWLADGDRGEVLRYNPSAKRIEAAYRVARPGDPLKIDQDGGMVSIRNERTGEMITVDMSKMRAAGARATGDKSKVLMAKGMMILVDGHQNTLTRVDPVRASDLGEPWRLPDGTAIADAAADDQGTVWVIGVDGVVHALAWNDVDAVFEETRSKAIHQVGDDALLAAHSAGVTVFGPRTGVVAQVGTQTEGYHQSNQLIGIDPVTTTGPSDLVPGALANQSAVVILDRGRMRHVSTVALGCARPTDPATFNDTVYVVCQGSHKVIRLTRDGREAGDAIPTPAGGDAQPVADEGRLLLNVSGASEGIEIDRSGTDQRFDRQPLAGAQAIQVQPGDARQGLRVGQEQAREDLNTPPPAGGPPRVPTIEVPTESQVLEGRTEVTGGTDNPPSVSGEAVIPPPPVEPSPVPEVPPAPTPPPVSQVPSAPVPPPVSQMPPAPTPPLSALEPPRSAEKPMPTESRPDGSSTSMPSAHPSARRGATLIPRRTEPAPVEPSRSAPEVPSTAPMPSWSIPVPDGMTDARRTQAEPLPPVAGQSAGTKPEQLVPTPGQSVPNPPVASQSARGSSAPSQSVPSQFATNESIRSAPSVPTPSGPLFTPPPTESSVSAPSRSAPPSPAWRETQPAAAPSSTRATAAPSSTRATASPTAGRATSSETMAEPTPSPGRASPSRLQPTPTPTPTALPSLPAAPTGVRGTHTGTLASVRFNPVAGATDYTISCNDFGETDLTGTSGEVSCGPESEGEPVRVGVRAHNEAGRSELIEARIDAD